MGIHAQTLVNIRIAKLRKYTVFNEKDFATLMGVSVQSLRNYESDKTDPSGAFFVKVCAIFGPMVVGWVLGHGKDDDIKQYNVRQMAKNHDRDKAVKQLSARRMATKFT